MTFEEVPSGPAPAEIEIAGSEARCSYLPEQRSTMVYRLAMRLSDARYEALLARGWRRFGRTLFRPVCAACRACQSLRVRIPEFRASRSQRRAASRLSDLQLTIRRPGLSDEHLSLYNRYHLDMHHRRGWPFREINRDQYFESFLDGNFTFAREFQYRQAGRLVGLGLVDLTASAMSSVYFIHDPAYRDAGIGTYSVLCEIAEGRRTGRRHLYLGYYIRDCQSMNYKNRYAPHEILQQYVSDDTEPSWQPADSSRDDAQDG